LESQRSHTLRNLLKSKCLERSKPPFGCLRASTHPPLSVTPDAHSESKSDPEFYETLPGGFFP